MREFPEIGLLNPANPATERIGPLHNMKTPTELRPIALAGILPFSHGAGYDSHGDPVPNAEGVISRALQELAEAGRLWKQRSKTPTQWQDCRTLPQGRDQDCV